ncbi:MAG: GNAT family N-acetyltransferase, partial [Thiohalocapsa sp.]
RAVFVREQLVPEQLEWDGADGDAIHLVAESGPGVAIGTARLLASGQIGRMAVLSEWRDQGVGTRLLMELLKIASATRYPTPFMHAQTAAVPFYRALGFKAEGEVFEEAGIPHQRMVLDTPKRLPKGGDSDRILGQTGGRFRLEEPHRLQQTVATLVAQARRELHVVTPDLEPTLYDRAVFLEQVRRLAIDRPARLPVRILLADADPAIRRGHRLIELSRKLASAVQIRAIPDEVVDSCDHFLLADDSGYCLRRLAAPETSLADFNDTASVRRLQQSFDRIWEQATTHAGLRRLNI